jgi:hypothetical protein
VSGVPVEEDILLPIKYTYLHFAHNLPTHLASLLVYTAKIINPLFKMRSSNILSMAASLALTNAIPTPDVQPRYASGYVTDFLDLTFITAPNTNKITIIPTLDGNPTLVYTAPGKSLSPPPPPPSPPPSWASSFPLLQSPKRFAVF